MREFRFSKDIADACVYLMENKDYKEIGGFVDVGAGKEISIQYLEIRIANIIGYKGNINWNKSKLNGTQRKLLDNSKLSSLGWKYKVKLLDGLKNVSGFSQFYILILIFIAIVKYII